MKCFRVIQCIFIHRGPPGEKGDTPKVEPLDGVPDTIVGPYGITGEVGEKGDRGYDGKDGTPGENGTLVTTSCQFIIPCLTIVYIFCFRCEWNSRRQWRKRFTWAARSQSKINQSIETVKI